VTALCSAAAEPGRKQPVATPALFRVEPLPGEAAGRSCEETGSPSAAVSVGVFVLAPLPSNTILDQACASEKCAVAGERERQPLTANRSSLTPICLLETIKIARTAGPKMHRA
jgi:hypothetical protein